MACEIAEYPTASQPRSGVVLLRARLTDLVERLAEMQSHEGPQLELIYQSRCGDLELELQATHVARLRAQRKLELIRAAMAQGQKQSIDLSAIERQLQTEFEQWTLSLNELAESVEHAKRLASKPVDPEDIKATARIKSLYRKLVRYLHPDMNGGRETALYRRFWMQIQTAYDEADLSALEALIHLVDDVQSGSASIVGLEADLRRRITQYEERVVELGKQWPFCVREELRDERWILERREKLASLCADNEEATSLLNMLLADLGWLHFEETIH